MSQTLSIIVLAYNEHENIVRCLKSCVEQTVLPDEILVVNNKSTDDTVELVENFFKEFKSKNAELLKNTPIDLRLVHQNKYQGINPTRDYGFNNSNCDILGRIDADAIIEKNWVAKVKHFFNTHPNYGGLTGPVAYYDMPTPRLSLYLDNFSRKVNLLMTKKYPFMYGSNMAITKKAWLKVKNQVCPNLDDNFHEDIDLAIHLIRNNFKIGYESKMIAFISARRIGTPFKEFRDYNRRFSRTLKHHKIYSLGQKFPESYIYVVYFLIHPLSKIYRPKVAKNLKILEKIK